MDRESRSLNLMAVFYWQVESEPCRYVSEGTEQVQQLGTVYYRLVISEGDTLGEMGWFFNFEQMI